MERRKTPTLEKWWRLLWVTIGYYRLPEQGATHAMSESPSAIRLVESLGGKMWNYVERRGRKIDFG
jgi:hypothetical protein